MIKQLLSGDLTKNVNDIKEANVYFKELDIEKIWLNWYEAFKLKLSELNVYIDIEKRNFALCGVIVTKYEVTITINNHVNSYFVAITKLDAQYRAINKVIENYLTESVAYFVFLQT